MRVYLDTCAINRLTDDPSQTRVRLEAEAMEYFFRHVQVGGVSWISSAILEQEIKRDPNTRRREDALSMLAYAAEVHLPNQNVVDRAKFLNSVGYGAFDALHLAMAEYSRADLLLTTDDQFLRQAGRSLGNPTVRVANPLNYAQEVKP